jgi:CHASE3 domain sensor protein
MRRSLLNLLIVTGLLVGIGGAQSWAADDEAKEAQAFREEMQAAHKKAMDRIATAWGEFGQAQNDELKKLDQKGAKALGGLGDELAGLKQKRMAIIDARAGLIKELQAIKVPNLPLAENLLNASVRSQEAYLTDVTVYTGEVIGILEDKDLKPEEKAQRIRTLKIPSEASAKEEKALEKVEKEAQDAFDAKYPKPRSEGAKPNQDENIRLKLMELRGILYKEIDLEMKGYEAGTRTIDSVRDSIRSFARTQLEIADTAEGRERALQDSMNWAEDLLKLTKAKFKDRVSTEPDFYAANALVVEIQIMQMREKAKEQK